MFDFSILGFFYTFFRILDSFFHTKYVWDNMKYKVCFTWETFICMIISHMFYSFHEKPNLDRYIFLNAYCARRTICLNFEWKHATCVPMHLLHLKVNQTEMWNDFMYIADFLDTPAT